MSIEERETDPLEGLEDVNQDIPEEIVEDIRRNMDYDDLDFNGLLDEKKMIYRNGELIETTVYDITTKINALSIMNASQRLYGGKMTPAFSRVAETLGITAVTLRRWWDNRKRILTEGKEHLDLAQQVKAVALDSTFKKILTKLDGVLDSEEFTKKDLSNLSKALATVAQNGRLFENKSTKNVEHEHKVRGRISYTMPDDVEGVEK